MRAVAYKSGSVTYRANYINKVELILDVTANIQNSTATCNGTTDIGTSQTFTIQNDYTGTLYHQLDWTVTGNNGNSDT